jgi:hypothetical protein
VALLAKSSNRHYAKERCSEAGVADWHYRGDCQMGDIPSGIVERYAKGGLLERPKAALPADGADPAHPPIDALAPYDHFHGSGLEATEDMAALVSVRPTDHLLMSAAG